MSVNFKAAPWKEFYSVNVTLACSNKLFIPVHDVAAAGVSTEAVFKELSNQEGLAML